MARSRSRARRATAISVVLIVLYGLSACGRATDTNDDQKLSEKLQMANTRIDQLATRLTRLELQVGLERSRYKSAVLDPGEKGFARLDTSVGAFAIVLDDVTPYADGVRVRLNVGNLTTATVNGGTFQVKWGPREPSSDAQDYLTKYDEWSKSLREKTVDFQEDLRSGTWNAVTLALPGVSPARLGYLELSMETNKISLVRAK